ncbi:hypothetical protein [Sphingomonas japonica]|nr:hypothetical protein [Sphingomonas japonica]
MISAALASIRANVLPYALAAALLAIMGVYLMGDHVGANRVKERHQAQLERIQAESDRLQRAADRLLVARQQQARTTIATDRKALDDAISQIPDRPTDDRQSIIACRELRRTSPALADTACAGVPAP